MPRPAAEFGGPVVGKGLVDFGLGVHHKRAVLGHRFAYRAALQHQQFGGVGATDQLNRLSGRQFNGGSR